MRAKPSLRRRTASILPRLWPMMSVTVSLTEIVIAEPGRACRAINDRTAIAGTAQDMLITIAHRGREHSSAPRRRGSSATRKEGTPFHHRRERQWMMERRQYCSVAQVSTFETAMTGIGRELPTVVASQFAMKRPFASSHELISVQPVVAALRPICHHFELPDSGRAPLQRLNLSRLLVNFDVTSRP